jgi:hypothetical protein
MILRSVMNTTEHRYFEPQEYAASSAAPATLARANSVRSQHSTTSSSFVHYPVPQEEVAVVAADSRL